MDNKTFETRKGPGNLFEKLDDHLEDIFDAGRILGCEDTEGLYSEERILRVVDELIEDLEGIEKLGPEEIQRKMNNLVLQGAHNQPETDEGLSNIEMLTKVNDFGGEFYDRFKGLYNLIPVFKEARMIYQSGYATGNVKTFRDCLPDGDKIVEELECFPGDMILSIAATTVYGAVNKS